MNDFIAKPMTPEAQEKKLEREFAREHPMITRDDRLETMDKDLV